MPLTLSIKGKKNVEISVGDKSTLRELKQTYSKATRKDYHRISFKVGETRLDDDGKLLVDDYKLSSGSEIVFKDLGPQIGYRTVFLVEYFGPILFVGLYALRPELIFGKGASSTPYNQVALTGIICWIAHFAKREFETIFIHKFSRPTMPLSNLFKNCAYYWLFGAFIGYPLCSPSFVAPIELQYQIGLGVFVLSELGNLICHLMLVSFRTMINTL